MAPSDNRVFVSGIGYVPAARTQRASQGGRDDAGGTTIGRDTDAAYVAEREAVQLEKIAASADRAFGRAGDPTSRARVRALLGLGDPARTEGSYDRLGR